MTWRVKKLVKTGDNKLRLSVLSLLGLMLIGGCGVYTFNPRGKSEISTISVETFNDETGQYQVADQMTQLVIDAFIADGTLKVVSSDAADAVLIGTLVRYERVAQEFDQQDQVSQYKILMDFDLTLQNPAENTDYWSISLPLYGLYNAVDETEDDGQQEVGEKLVEAVLNKTTKSW